MDKYEGWEWFYLDDEAENKGPFNTGQLVALFSEGVVTSETMVWAAECAEWETLSSIPDLYSLMDAPGRSLTTVHSPIHYPLPPPAPSETSDHFHLTFPTSGEDSPKRRIPLNTTKHRKVEILLGCAFYLGWLTVYIMYAIILPKNLPELYSWIGFWYHAVMYLWLIYMIGRNKIHDTICCNKKPPSKLPSEYDDTDFDSYVASENHQRSFHLKPLHAPISPTQVLGMIAYTIVSTVGLYLLSVITIIPVLLLGPLVLTIYLVEHNSRDVRNRHAYKCNNCGKLASREPGILMTDTKCNKYHDFSSSSKCNKSGTLVLNDKTCVKDLSVFLCFGTPGLIALGLYYGLVINPVFQSYAFSFCLSETSYWNQYRYSTLPCNKWNYSMAEYPFKYPPLMTLTMSSSYINKYNSNQNDTTNLNNTGSTILLENTITQSSLGKMTYVSKGGQCAEGTVFFLFLFCSFFLTAILLT